MCRSWRSNPSIRSAKRRWYLWRWRTWLGSKGRSIVFIPNFRAPRIWSNGSASGRTSTGCTKPKTSARVDQVRQKKRTKKKTTIPPGLFFAKYKMWSAIKLYFFPLLPVICRASLVCLYISLYIYRYRYINWWARFSHSHSPLQSLQL